MRLAFIAMSGVRAYSEKLMEIGLTLPGVLERGQLIASMPSLSLLTLAALTPPDIKVDYYEIKDIRNEQISLKGYDLVALSSFSAQIYDAYKVADECRKDGVPVVIGGLHVIALPDEALKHANSVVVGEGEMLWPKVIQDFLDGRLKERYVQEETNHFDLANAPLPRYELLVPERYNRLTVQTSRGCPHRCEFCASSIRLTSTYRVKPVERVIAEIHRIKEIWKHPFIEFADDNSFVVRKHTKELLLALKQERLHWFTEADISIAEDEELLTLLRESGCRQLLIGLESPTKGGIAGIEQRNNWKEKKFPEYMQAIKKIQSHGVTVDGCFILGMDGNTSDVFDAIYDFVEEAELFDVQLTILTPFPGTPLYHRLKTEGRLIEDLAWYKCTLFDINYIPKNMSVDELEAGLIKLGQKLYNKEAVLSRHKRFFDNLPKHLAPHSNNIMEGLIYSRFE